ncbi:hypothetical protein FRC18_004254 [Serendipita sp. 400]|nr:hypothetical protein FRC18_004254 [Serendipita sp. 400]
MSTPPPSTSDAMMDVLPTSRHSGETTAIDTSTPLTLWCFVPGKTAPFRVTIARTHLVDDLKEAIYNKTRTLSFTSPHVLTLYLLNLPDDDGLLDAVNDMRLNPKSCLRVTKRLSQVFPAVLKDDTVHILVQPPQLDGNESTLWMRHLLVILSPYLTPGSTPCSHFVFLLIEPIDILQPTPLNLIFRFSP